VRPWYARLGGTPTLDGLNALAEEAGLRTAGGRAVRFVPPAAADPYYEIKVFESGCVQTRPDSLHDLFNALAWLAFPRTKARINAMHAAEIPREREGREMPRERQRRGPLRDLLTIFDEGGAIVVCDDAELLDLFKTSAWKALFFENRERARQKMEVTVFGHATMEQWLDPRPGITCKAIVLPDGNLDEGVARWLAEAPADTSPKALLPLPVSGIPGWTERQDAAFYEDRRYFRP
jgi:hypothetical protein